MMKITQAYTVEMYVSAGHWSPIMVFTVENAAKDYIEETKETRPRRVQPIRLVRGELK